MPSWRRLDLLPNQRQHALGIEDLFFAQAGHGIGRVVPEDFAVAVVPGVEALVELRGQFGRNAGSFGGGGDQLGVQQLPAQAAGQIVGKLAAARAVLALDGNDSDGRMPHGRMTLREGAYNGLRIFGEAMLLDAFGGWGPSLVMEAPRDFCEIYRKGEQRVNRPPRGGYFSFRQRAVFCFDREA